MPAITAKRTSSRMQSIATCVASRAARILRFGAPIEPDASMIRITAASGVPAGPPEPSEVMVTIALTSVPPSGRYSFW